MADMTYLAYWMDDMDLEGYGAWVPGNEDCLWWADGCEWVSGFDGVDYTPMGAGLNTSGTTLVFWACEPDSPVLSMGQDEIYSHQVDECGVAFRAAADTNVHAVVSINSIYQEPASA